MTELLMILTKTYDERVKHAESLVIELESGLKSVETRMIKLTDENKNLRKSESLYFVIFLKI